MELTSKKGSPFAWIDPYKLESSQMLVSPNASINLVDIKNKTPGKTRFAPIARSQPQLDRDMRR